RHERGGRRRRGGIVHGRDVARGVAKRSRRRGLLPAHVRDRNALIGDGEERIHRVPGGRGRRRGRRLQPDPPLERAGDGAGGAGTGDLERREELVDGVGLRRPRPGRGGFFLARFGAIGPRQRRGRKLVGRWSRSGAARQEVEIGKFLLGRRRRWRRS